MRGMVSPQWPNLRGKQTYKLISVSKNSLMNIQSYAASSATAPLAPFSLERRAPAADDVQIEILFCGVCHSDVHTVRGEWQGTTYPCVPGHEIVGRVTQVGAAVTHFKVGDLAGVGCLVDSCHTCGSCHDDLEQFCENAATFTYNSPDKHSGGVTYGGYSESIVVSEAFVLKLPSNLDLAATAPLLCAGITTYSPLRHYDVGEGHIVGVVGLGGLGHMAVKLAKAMGAHVVVFTTSTSKVAERSGFSTEPAAKASRGGKPAALASTAKAAPSGAVARLAPV